MEIWEQTGTWIFLAVWSTISSFYWYFRFKVATRVLSDPKFLEYVIEQIKEMEKDGRV